MAISGAHCCWCVGGHSLSVARSGVGCGRGALNSCGGDDNRTADCVKRRIVSPAEPVLVSLQHSVSVI